MTFVHPAYLYLLPLGAIPIIIYYLMRYRSLKVVWGANYVLELALERLKKKFYWDQILLLALRVLVCLALVLAFARPVSKASGLTVSATGKHRVLVVDASYSMLAGPPGQTRWDKACEAMKQLVNTWGRGEAWSLYVVDEKPHWAVHQARIVSTDESAAILDAIEVTESAASMAKTLQHVAERFPSESVEVYVFADDQASTWEGAHETLLPSSWQRPVYWMNPPPDDSTNLAVTSARFAYDRALRHHPTRFFIKIRNFGSEPARNAPVQVLVDGTHFDEKTVSLLPGQEGTLDMDIPFESPGAHFATARVGKDALSFDNAMSSGIDVADRISVLVLRDPGKTGKFDSAWEFLQVLGRVEAMTGENDEPLFAWGPVTFALAEDVPSRDQLAKADVVLLDGGRALSLQLASALREYVSEGGGLLLAADESIDTKTWNDLLGRQELLPAPIETVKVETLGGDRFKAVSRTEFDCPALQAFESEDDGDIAKSRIYSWCEFGAVPEGAAVLARFSDRQPFAIRKRGDLGSVVLLAAGLNGRSNNLIVREFLPPLLFRLFSEAASGRVYPRTVGRGSLIGLRLSDPNVKGVSLAVEGRKPVPATLQERQGAVHAIVPAGAPVTGLGTMLVVRDDGTSRVWFGVQGERVDSDLKPVSPKAKSEITERLGLTEVRTWQELDEQLKAGRRGAEWHHWVVLGLLIILAAEWLLELRFI